ncbi:MAG: S24 family peptidase [Amylibacter sp.]|nr:S24 family peptidase [Amylibacter sp.]
MDMILNAIDGGLEKKGLSDAAASKLAVGHPSLIKNFRMPRSGEKRYNVGALEKLAEVLDLEFYFGPKRIPEKTALDCFAEKAAQFTYAVDGSPEALKEGFLPIPYNKHDPKHQDDGVAPVAFSRTWMIGRGLNPDKLSMIEVPNDRMAPTIRKGALALIDSGPDDNDNLVWAFLESGKLDVARLCFMGESGRIVIRDHPDELPIIAPTASIAPLGRIVWVAANF